MPQIVASGGLCIKISHPSVDIHLSYKPCLALGGEIGLNMRVAYPVNFFQNKSKPCSAISHTASRLRLMPLLCA